MNRKIAFLVYDSWKEGRNKNTSFEGKNNIGSFLLINELKKKNIEISFCSVDTAKKFDIILISFTSNYDILAFYKAVARHSDWGKRNFITLGGGFGMQNPIPIKEFLDFAWFGRCENEIVDLVLNLPNFEHESLMNLKNIKQCKINQSYNLYTDEIILRENQKNRLKWKEYMYGCPNKCFYCHYTWARKHIKTNEHFFSKVINNSLEIDPFNEISYNSQTNKLIIGLDGLTEKIRYFVNRKLSDEKLKELIINVNAKSKKEWKAQIIQFYNITGFEIEKGDEINNFIELLNEVDKQIKNPLKIILHTTPLHSSPLTPIQYSKLNINTKNNRNASKRFYVGKNIDAMHSPFLESDWSVIEACSVERGTEKTQDIFNAIVFNPKLHSLRAEDKIKALQYKYDINDYIREYDINERIPTWFLNSYTDNKIIKNFRIRMKNILKSN